MAIDPLKCNLATPSNARRHILEKINEMVSITNAVISLINEILENEYVTMEEVERAIAQKPGVLIATFTKEGDKTVCDVPFEDIVAALSSNKTVVGMYKPYSASECNPLNVVYYHFDSDGANTHCIFGGNPFFTGTLVYRANEIGNYL